MFHHTWKSLSPRQQTSAKILSKLLSHHSTPNPEEEILTRRRWWQMEQVERCHLFFFGLHLLFIRCSTTLSRGPPTKHPSRGFYLNGRHVLIVWLITVYFFKTFSIQFSQKNTSFKITAQSHFIYSDAQLYNNTFWFQYWHLENRFLPLYTGINVWNLPYWWGCTLHNASVREPKQQLITPLNHWHKKIKCQFALKE